MRTWTRLLAATLFLLVGPGVSADDGPAPFKARDGLVLGRVFLDMDGDGSWSSGDQALAAVELWSSDGHRVWTDSEGRYHLQGLESGQEIRGSLWLKVESSSLPAGTILPQGGHRLVKIMPMGIARVDFALRPPSWKTPQPTSLAPSPEPAPDRAQARNHQEIETWLQGEAQPGCRVMVGPQSAEVSAGGFKAPVLIRPGITYSLVARQCPDGRLDVFEVPTFWRQRSQGGDLIMSGSSRHLMSCQGPDPFAVQSAASMRLRCRLRDGVKAVFGSLASGTGSAEWLPELPLQAGPNDFDLQIQIADRAHATRLSWHVLPTRWAGAISGVMGLRLGTDAEHQLAWGGSLRGRLEAQLPLDVKFVLQGRADSVDVSTAQAAKAALAPTWDPWTWQQTYERESSWWVVGDSCLTSHDNASLGRYDLSLRRGDSRLGWGQFTWDDATAQDQLGQFRVLAHGAHARLRLLEDWFGGEQPTIDVRLEGFYARQDPMAASPMSSYGPSSAEAMRSRPAHDEFLSTGGSLYFLSHPWVVEGSERLVLQQRDRRTGMLMASRRLRRGRDYELDPLGGRLLLKQIFDEGAGSSGAVRLLAQGDLASILVADYNYLDPAASAPEDGMYAGQVLLAGRPTEALRLSARAGAQGAESGDYQLWTGRLEAEWTGTARVWATWADSQGRLLEPAYSVDGGLSLASAPAPRRGEGEAYEAGAELVFGPSRSLLRFRRQLAGFADSARVVGDDLTQFLASSSLDLGQAWRFNGRFSTSHWDPGTLWEGRLEVDFRPWDALQLSAAAVLDLAQTHDDPTGRFQRAFGDGRRGMVGLRASYRLLDWLSVLAGHQQSLLHEGQGAVGRDLSLSTLGIQFALEQSVQVGLEGGWGPETGNLFRLSLGEDRADGSRVFANTDLSPGLTGLRRSGLRAGQSAPIGETGWRLSQTQSTLTEPGASMQGQRLGAEGPLSERWRMRLGYERSELHEAADHALRRDLLPSGFWDRSLELAALAGPGRRNAVFGALSYRGERLQTELAAEYRMDEHLPLALGDLWQAEGPDSQRQTVLRLALAWQPAHDWSLGGRVAWAESFAGWTGQGGPGLPEGGFLEASVGLAYRPAELNWFRLMIRAAGGREQRPWRDGPEYAFAGAQDWAMANLALLFEPAPWIQPTLVAAPFLREFRYNDGRTSERQAGLLSMLRLSSEIWRGLGVAAEGRLRALWQDEQVFPERDGDSMKLGLACELYYRLEAGPSLTRLAVGYSFSDVPDPLLQDLDAGGQGVFLRLEGAL